MAVMQLSAVALPISVRYLKAIYRYFADKLCKSYLELPYLLNVNVIGKPQRTEWMYGSTERIHLLSSKITSL